MFTLTARILLMIMLLPRHISVVGDIAGRLTLERMRRDVFCRRLCLSDDYLLDNNDKSEICLLAPMLTY